MTGLTLTPSDFRHRGFGLVRPECVVAAGDDVLVSDGRGGITHLHPDGTQHLVQGLGGQPNGFALTAAGSIVSADMDRGIVQLQRADGSVAPLLAGAVDGVTLSCANHVTIDSLGRLWASFSSREPHWWPAAATPRADGYIVLLDGRGARIVVDGLWFTNEIHFDAAERFLYVAETSANRVSRFAVLNHAAARLGERETYGPATLSPHGAIDGFAFDEEGTLWLADVVRNAIETISPDGSHHVVFDSADPARLDAFQAKRDAGTATPADMAEAVARPGSPLLMPTSLAFGGPRRLTVHVGSLAMDRIACFEAPVAGTPQKRRRLFVED